MSFKLQVPDSVTPKPYRQVFPAAYSFPHTFAPSSQKESLHGRQRSCQLNKVAYSCGHTGFVPGAQRIIHSTNCKAFPADDIHCPSPLLYPSYPSIPIPCPTCTPSSPSLLATKAELVTSLARWIIKAMKALDNNRTQYWTWDQPPLLLSGPSNRDLLAALGQEFTLCLLDEIMTKKINFSRAVLDADEPEHWEVLGGKVDVEMVYEVLEEGGHLRYQLQAVERPLPEMEALELTKVQIFDHFNALLDDEAVKVEMEEFELW